MAAQVPSRLYRSRSQKMISGVCGGLGEYFDVDPVLIRLLFVVTTFISGVGILAYIVLWIVVPFEGDDGPRFDALRRDFDDFSGRVRDYVDRPSADRASTPRGDTPPAGTAAVPGDAASSPGTAGDPQSAARHATTHPYEDSPMSTDSTSARVPLHDEPVDPASPVSATTSATATADELTIGAEPPPPPRPPESPSAPRTSASAGSPFADLYGPPPSGSYGTSPGGSYGPPPPYEPPSYGSAPFAPPIAPPTDRRKRRQHWAGAILIVLGLLFLGHNLGLLWWIEPEYLLPLILVGAGAWLLFGRGRRG